MPTCTDDAERIGGGVQDGLDHVIGAEARLLECPLDPAPDALMTNLNATHTPPVIQSPHEAAGQAVLGGSIAVRLRSEQTDARLGLVEQVVPAGFPGPAMHVHPDFDETFYVLEGTLAFRAGDRAYDAPAGTVAFIPRGTPHTFANPADAPARSLVLVTPGGFERYFQELIDLVERSGGLPPEAELRDLGVAHGSLPSERAPG